MYSLLPNKEELFWSFAAMLGCICLICNFCEGSFIDFFPLLLSNLSSLHFEVIASFLRSER